MNTKYYVGESVNTTRGVGEIVAIDKDRDRKFVVQLQFAKNFSNDMLALTESEISHA